MKEDLSHNEINGGPDITIESGPLPDWLTYTADPYLIGEFATHYCKVDPGQPLKLNIQFSDGEKLPESIADIDPVAFQRLSRTVSLEGSPGGRYLRRSNEIRVFPGHLLVIAERIYLHIQKAAQTYSPVHPDVFYAFEASLLDQQDYFNQVYQLYKQFQSTENAVLDKAGFIQWCTSFLSSFVIAHELAHAGQTDDQYRENYKAHLYYALLLHFNAAPTGIGLLTEFNRRILDMSDLNSIPFALVIYFALIYRQVYKYQASSFYRHLDMLEWDSRFATEDYLENPQYFSMLCFHLDKNSYNGTVWNGR